MDTPLLKIFVIAGIIAFTGCDSANKSAPEENTTKAEDTSSTSQDKGSMAEGKSMGGETPMGEGMSGSMQEKPSMHQETVSTLEATVTAIDQATREVTLKSADGESVSFIAGDEVKNLAQVKVGDKLKLEYLESVTVQVLEAGQADVGAETVAGAARAKPGEKPAGVAISETTVVVVIEAIDKEHEKVTLKGPEGKTKTVKVRNPENLEKVAIGDKVMITYTEALAVKITAQ